MLLYSVLVGKHKLSDEPLGVAEHWAIGIEIDDVVYWNEVRSSSKSEGGALNIIQRNADSDKYTRIKIVGEKSFDGGADDC